MLRRLAAMLGVVSIACGGGSTAPADEVPFDYEFADPAGDTAAATANPDSVKAIDLLKVSGRIDKNNLTVILDFGEAVTRWTAAVPNSLDGFIDIDPDVTGDLENQFYLDLRDNGSGQAGLVNPKKRTVTLVKIRFDGTRVEVDIPRAAISSAKDADNQLQLSVEVGARRRLPVDRSPNTGAHALKPPAS